MMSVPKNNGPIVDPALCRCCRAIKKCRILTAEYTWMGKKEIYADMVMDCYGILLSHVDDNERDSGVCATCVVRLREAIAFRHQVLQCEELFLQAKLENHDEEEKDETRLKKFDLELKTEPKDYNSDHNSLDDRDDPCPAYSDDDADDDKPLKKEVRKPAEPPTVKEDGHKSEDSLDFHGDSSSDSDEPVKKKAKRKAKESKAKANGAKKKPGKTAKKLKAETGNTDTDNSEKIEENYVTHEEFDAPSIIVERIIGEPEYLIIKIEANSATHESITEAIRETITSAETGTRIVETTVEKPIFTVPVIKTKYEKACQEMELNEELYFEHYNMSKETFNELFDLMKSSIEKHLCTKKPIPARQRLAICLRRLKTGESCRALAGYHGIGRSTTAKIVLEVSKAIWDVLQPLCMPMPTEETWIQCEKDFQDTWNIPNCIGSLGGRHLISKMATKNETVCFRSKSFSSALLIAIADAFYNLILIDIGNYGELDEKDIFERTSFFKDFLCDKTLLPIKPLPNTEVNVPQVFIGSDGLPLTSYMLCEYPKHRSLSDPALKRFNDCIRPARTVDRVFDMLMSNWKIFREPTDCSIDTSVNLTKAVCCLHNFTRSRHGDLEVKDDVVVVKHKRALKGLVPIRPVNRRSTNIAMSVRNIFTEYFSREAGIEVVCEEVCDEVCEEESPLDVELTVESEPGEPSPE